MEVAPGFRAAEIELATNGNNCRHSFSTCAINPHPKGELGYGVVHPSPINNQLKDCCLNSSCDGTENSNIFSGGYHLRMDLEDSRNQIFHAFDRSSSTSAVSEITLITGSSGAGKSTFSALLKNAVEAKHGFFLRGKFENKRFGSPPYLPFLRMCSEFLTQILHQRGNHDEIADLKKEVMCNLDLDDIRLFCDLIPELKFVLEKDDDPDSDRRLDDATTMYTERHRRLTTILLNFVRVISNSKFPVILVLDDLQWSDSSSLELLKTIALEMTKKEGFMIVGICSTDDITYTHAVSIFLRDLEINEVSINEVKIPSITETLVREYLSNVLKLPDDECMVLSNTATEVSLGNIYFLKHFLNILVDKNILTKSESDSWKLDIVQFHIFADDIKLFDVLAQRVKCFDNNVQRFLQIASCIGFECKLKLLDDLTSGEVDIQNALRVATRMDILSFDECSNCVRFIHHEIHKACYSLIPEDSREYLHLELGRKLLHKPESIHSASYIFDMVDQLLLGVHLIETFEERNQLATLCLYAGERALSCSAFLSASQYLDRGIDILSNRHWRDEYDLSLALYSSQAEVEYVLGNFNTVSHSTRVVIENARSFEDKLRAYTVMVYAFGATNQPSEAQRTGLEVLKELGENFPKKFLILNIIKELIKTRLSLRRFTHESIINLKPMQDNRRLAAMRILAVLFPCMFSCNPEFVPLITFRMVQMTLQYGLSAMSSSAFAAYGMLLSCSFSDVEEGYRYGQLALQLANKFNSKEWCSRCYTAVYGMINTWKFSFRLSLPLLHEAHCLGRSTGDVEFGMLSAALYSSISIPSANKPLSILIEEMKGFKDLMITSNQYNILAMLLPSLQMALNLKGNALNSLVLSGDVMNEEMEIKRAEDTKNSSVISLIHRYRTILAYYDGAHDAALKAGKDYFKVNRSTISCFGDGEQYFFECLSALALAQIESKRINMRIARVKLKGLENLTKYGNSMLTNRVQLVRGEFAACNGELESALLLFKCSAEFAEADCNLSDRALAYERAGMACYASQFWEEAISFLTLSSKIYELWGATIRVNSIQKCLQTSQSYPPTNGTNKVALRWVPRYVDEKVESLSTTA